MTAPQTMVKAINVPVDTSSPRSPIGITPATTAATAPDVTTAKRGVPERGSIEHRRTGNRPSRAMANSNRDRAKIATSTAEPSPIDAAIPT